MLLRSTVLVPVVVSALALLGATGAHGQDGKTVPTGQLGIGDQRLLAAEAAAGRAVPAVDPAVASALSTIQSRIVSFVNTNGTRYSFGSFLDPARGKVVIETDAPADTVSSLVGQHTGMVDVRTARVFDTSRCADIPPFWGGACVTATPGTRQCTTGFTVKNLVGTRFMVTASHCFPNGSTVFTPPGLTMGTVTSGPPNMDAALIGGQSYGARIYVTETTSNQVVAAANPVVGFTNYCHSGWMTGEQCGHTATSVNAIVCTPGGCRGPLVAFTGGVLPRAGDSGGPFYAKSGTNIHIRGIVGAGSTANTSYGEMWSRISTTFGVSIVT